MVPPPRHPDVRGGLLALVLLAAIAFPCGGRCDDATGRIVHISVDRGARVYLDGEQVAFDALTNRLSALDGRAEVVAFSGDLSDTNGAGAAVFDRVIRAGVPVVMRAADGSPRDADDASLRDVDFQQLPVSQVLDYYAGVTGAKLLNAAGVDARVSLSVRDATDGEAIKAVEIELSKYGIAVSRTEDGDVSVRWKADW